MSEQSFEDQLQEILKVRKKTELELTKVIEFEEKLSQVSPQRIEVLRPDMLTPYTIDKLAEEFPFLDWKMFFNSAIESISDSSKLNAIICNSSIKTTIFQ